MDTIIWAYGHDKEDGTTGHIDGIARFSNSNTIVIGDFETDINTAALVDQCKEKGLNVVRFPGSLNWLVGNGFVLAMGENDHEFDQQMVSILTPLFPDRNIHMIDGNVIAEAGGGIHCVTNDQPLF